MLIRVGRLVQRQEIERKKEEKRTNGEADKFVNHRAEVNYKRNLIWEKISVKEKFVIGQLVNNPPVEFHFVRNAVVKSNSEVGARFFVLNIKSPVAGGGGGSDIY